MTPTAAVLLGIAAGAAFTAGRAAQALAHELADAQHAANHDPLTGLLNRAGFESAGAELIDAAGEDATVALWDLDRFKPVNDRLGHDVGDEVLTEVARRLRVVVGGRGIVGRLGGDEFVAVLDASAAGTVRILAAARAAVAVPIPVETVDGRDMVQVGVSAGVAAVKPGTSLSELLKAADTAMYVAKREGQDWMAQQTGTLAVEHRPAQRLRDETPAQVTL